VVVAVVVAVAMVVVVVVAVVVNLTVAVSANSLNGSRNVVAPSMNGYAVSRAGRRVGGGADLSLRAP